MLYMCDVLMDIVTATKTKKIFSLQRSLLFWRLRRVHKLRGVDSSSLLTASSNDRLLSNSEYRPSRLIAWTWILAQPLITQRERNVTCDHRRRPRELRTTKRTPTI